MTKDEQLNNRSRCRILIEHLPSGQGCARGEADRPIVVQLVELAAASRDGSSRRILIEHLPSGQGYSRVEPDRPIAVQLVELAIGVSDNRSRCRILIEHLP